MPTNRSEFELYELKFQPHKYISPVLFYVDGIYYLVILKIPLALLLSRQILFIRFNLL